MQRFVSLCLIFIVIFYGTLAVAQTPAPPPDTITFTNGDTLSGHLVRATSSNVTFHSDSAGDVTVDWSKVKTLQTQTPVAIIRKDMDLFHQSAYATVPVGTLVLGEQRLIVTPPAPASPQTVLLADTAVVVQRTAFETATTRNRNWLHDWKGTLAVGAAIVSATQDSQTYTSRLALVRAEPGEEWLPPHDRTTINFSNAYGKINEPATPPQTGSTVVKTSIFHADAEQDEYLSHEVFLFGQGAYDHNFSQGLDLQQTYSGGLGWTVIDTANEVLDLKASGSYLRQQFSSGTQHDLAGSVFGQHYNRRLPHDMIFDERLTYTPTWNITEAWSAAFASAFTIPFYKNLAASTSVADNYLNNPPSGFRRNSFQFTVGATITLTH